MDAYDGRWRASSVGEGGDVGLHAEASRRLHSAAERVSEALEGAEHHLLGPIQLILRVGSQLHADLRPR